MSGSWPSNVVQFGNLCKDDRVRSEKEARTMTVLSYLEASLPSVILLSGLLGPIFQAGICKLDPRGKRTIPEA